MNNGKMRKMRKQKHIVPDRPDRRRHQHQEQGLSLQPRQAVPDRLHLRPVAHFWQEEVHQQDQVHQQEGGCVPELRASVERVRAGELSEEFIHITKDKILAENANIYCL